MLAFRSPRTRNSHKVQPNTGVRNDTSQKSFALNALSLHVSQRHSGNHHNAPLERADVHESLELQLFERSKPLVYVPGTGDGWKLLRNHRIWWLHGIRNDLQDNIGWFAHNPVHIC